MQDILERTVHLKHKRIEKLMKSDIFNCRVNDVFCEEEINFGPTFIGLNMLFT